MKGHRLRGTISGLISGIGIAILVQQYAFAPLTVLMLVLVPLGMAVVGIGLGWPRRPHRRAAPSPVPGGVPGVTSGPAGHGHSAPRA